MAEKPRFQMRMIGEGIAPETVRLSDLADFAASLEAAITSASPEGALPDDPDEAVVSLVGIERGSNKLTFAIAGSALLSVGAITRAISASRYGDLPPRTHEKLHEISKQAIRKGWAVEFIADKRQDIAEAIISDERPVPPPAPTVVTGPTTIWGRLMRVGGAKPRAELRLPNGDLLYFDLTAELAKQLSDGLYETVSVEGTATWAVDSRKLTDFKATRVTDYRPEQSSLTRAFEELATASKGRWDDVDAVPYVTELRSED